MHLTLKKDATKPAASRGFMVLAECALAIVLLAAAGLLLRSLGRLLSIDPGFDQHSRSLVST